MGQFDISIPTMLFEGGALIGALNSNTQGQRLADKVEALDREAFGAGQTQFTLVLDPVEAGIAIQALNSGGSDLGKFLGSRLKAALDKLLSDNNIAYGNDFGQQGGGGGQTGLGEPTGGDPSPTGGLGTPSDPSDSSGQPSDGGQPSSDQQPSPSDGLGAPTDGSNGSSGDGSPSDPSQPADDGQPSSPDDDTSKDGPQTP